MVTCSPLPLVMTRVPVLRRGAAVRVASAPGIGVPASAVGGTHCEVALGTGVEVATGVGVST
jgi:hypothetical protein